MSSVADDEPTAKPAAAVGGAPAARLPPSNEDASASECWTPKEIWIDASSESKKVVKTNLMLYVGKETRCRREKLYLSPEFNSTDEFTRQKLTAHLVNSCAQAGFPLKFGGFTKKDQKASYTCYCCSGGPRSMDVGCKFRFSAHWDAVRNLYFVKPGFGFAEHEGHAKTSPEQVHRALLEASHWNRQPSKPRAKPGAKSVEAGQPKKFPTNVVVDNDLNWRPEAIWLDGTLVGPQDAVDSSADQEQLELVNLMDYLGATPKATQTFYFPATFSDTEPETRKKLREVILQACAESDCPITSKGFDKGNRFRFMCKRHEIHRQNSYAAGTFPAVCPILSMKQSDAQRPRPVCQSDRCPFRFTVHFQSHLKRYTIDPGAGYDIHIGHRKGDDGKKKKKKKGDDEATEQAREADHVKAWEGGNALQRYLPFFEGACRGADYCYESDKILRQRLADMIEEIRVASRQKFDDENMQAGSDNAEAAVGPSALSPSRTQNENSKRDIGSTSAVKDQENDSKRRRMDML